MPTVFEPRRSPLDQIFSKDMRYVIPEYQRPYAWQSEGKSDRNSQINHMWDDLWNFFCEQSQDKEYFLGSMVIIEEELRRREVVDGQQRLTSLLLLFSAMRCFLQRWIEAQKPENDEHEIVVWAKRGSEKLRDFIYNEKSFGLSPDIKVKIERSSGYDFDETLSLAVNCGEKKDLPAHDARYQEVSDPLLRQP
ncbi:MAG: DUF262 domain-containing protein [Polyangiales bacterium]